MSLHMLKAQLLSCTLLPLGNTAQGMVSQESTRNALMLWINSMNPKLQQLCVEGKKVKRVGGGLKKKVI